jgi:hypothetical protein
LSIRTTLRFAVALLVAIFLSAALDSLFFFWPRPIMGPVFIVYVFCAAALAVLIGLPIYSYQRSRHKDNLTNSVGIIAFIYGAVYLVGRACLVLNTTSETIDGVKIVDGGLYTLHGWGFVLVSTAEVVTIGCLANLAFWLLFARARIGRVFNSNRR